MENLKLNLHHVETGNIDNLSFEICSKMVNHATAVMLRDSVDDAEGRYRVLLFIISM